MAVLGWFETRDMDRSMGIPGGLAAVVAREIQTVDLSHNGTEPRFP